LDSSHVLDLEVNTSDDNIVSNAYVYDVPCTVIPIANREGTINTGNLSQQTTRINLAVMAEGYRADQINDFVANANNAFATTASFHYNSTTNDFYNRYYNDLNIVRYDTISPESGVDLLSLHDDVKSILNYNNAKGVRTADLNRIKAVLDKSKKNNKCDLKISNVDAVILLINTPTINTTTDSWLAHTWTFDNNTLHNRNGEPVHYLAIAAPVAGENGLYAIAHELGHALASLQDEYDTNNDPAQTCNRFFLPPVYPPQEDRNITKLDLFGNYIFQWDQFVIDYGSGLALNYPVNYFEGGYYCNSDYFRPTEYSTMKSNFTGNPPIDIGVQFGPVNTYYLYGSFRHRKSSITYTLRHQYPQYYNDFLATWPVTDF
jgi:hypothetical protein